MPALVVLLLAGHLLLGRTRAIATVVVSPAGPVPQFQPTNTPAAFPLSKMPVLPVSAATPSPSRTAASGSQHVVVLGDSVPAGDGCSCTPYATLLAQKLSSRHGQPVTVTNAGVGGLTTTGLVSQLADPAVEAALHTATVVAVTIGANDFDESLAADPACAPHASADCYSAPSAALPAALTTVLQHVRSLTSAGTPVLVTGYWNVFLDGAVGDAHGTTYMRTADALTRSVNSIVAETAAANGDVYINEYTPFHARTAAGLTALLAADGDHPSEAGHQLIADLLLAALPAST